MDQRNELARQFRETYAVAAERWVGLSVLYRRLRHGRLDRQPGVVDYSRLLVFALAAGLATALWFNQPVARRRFGSTLGASSWLAALVHFEAGRGGRGFLPCSRGFARSRSSGTLRSSEVRAGRRSEKPWRTINISFRRMSFEDKTLNDNVRYARHAISIDENRAASRASGGAAPKVPARQGRTGARRSSSSGSLAIIPILAAATPRKLRLSDITLAWMADAANGQMRIMIDKSELQLPPPSDGMQHDQRKAGFPLLTSWLHLTWQGKQRDIGNPNAPLDDSVYARFALPGVIHYDAVQPYRPRGCGTMRGLRITTPTFRCRLCKRV